MKRVFEPLELDLVDARLLPNRVIEVQSKVKELLSTNLNPHRKAALVEELSSQKAWGLPGLINASMVFADRLDNKKNRSEFASIIATVSSGNSTAIKLLLESGIYENPFYESRAVILEAIQLLDWRPDQEEIRRIRKFIKRLQDGDDLWLLDLYRLYLKSNLESAYEEGIKLCEKWFKIPTELAKDLFRELLVNFPENTVKTIKHIFLAVTEISKEARKEKEFANKLIQSIPIDVVRRIVKDGSLIEISEIVLEEINVPRYKAIEQLWVYSIREIVKERQNLSLSELDALEKKIIELDKQYSSSIRDSIIRYWTKALGMAGLFDFLIDRVYNGDDEAYKLLAAVQLFFQESNIKVKQALSDLERDNNKLYLDAQEKFKLFKEKQNSDIKPIHEKKAKRGPDLAER